MFFLFKLFVLYNNSFLSFIASSLINWWKKVCLPFVLVCFQLLWQTPQSKATWKGKKLFALHIYIMVHRGKTGKTVTQTEAEAEAGTVEKAAHWSLPRITFDYLSFISRIIFPRETLPTVGLVLPYHINNWLTKCHTDLPIHQSDEGKVEVPSIQMTLACAKFTKTNLCIYTSFS